jgi:hypothetical protein
MLRKYTCASCGARFAVFGQPRYCPKCGLEFDNFGEEELGEPCDDFSSTSLISIREKRESRGEVRKCGRCKGTGEYPPEGGFFQKGVCKACNGKGWVRI